ncbi:hypothetical protein GGI64_002080 [Rhizobium leguminosarum]|uniref:Uncharacterized protein n=1 Tax=Rhizobium leguminosarum TaxID=384 RepID=A0A7Z0IXV5_RHILE|nr:hypothetical protein [Rhizobium leguminosarum]
MDVSLTAGAVEIDWRGWPEGITEAVLQGAVALRAAKPKSHVTLVVANPPVNSAQRQCLREALRGLIHSSVLERPDIRSNLAFGGMSEDRQRIIAYLDRATFVFGATIDLGNPS